MIFRGRRMAAGAVRRHRRSGGLWTRPRPQDDADVDRILSGFGVGAAPRHLATDETDRHHLASVHVPTVPISLEEIRAAGNEYTAITGDLPGGAG